MSSKEFKIIPNESDFFLRIESELKYDSLYNLIIERDQLKKELFYSDFISILEKDIYRWFSVAEAGRVLGGNRPISPSTLTYYIDNLKEYIIPEDAPSNKYIRLNYLSLLKLKMVLLLKDEFRLNGIKAEVGITGNRKNVIKKENSSILSENDFDLDDVMNRLENMEIMNEMLLGLLVERGDNDIPRLKKPLQTLLNSDILSIEGQNELSQKIDKQNELIENLIEEKKKLEERLKKNEEVSESFEKKWEVNEKEREKILESEIKLNNLTDTFRARQKAEAEWEKLSILKRLKGNRTDYVNQRIKALLEEEEDEEK